MNIGSNIENIRATLPDDVTLVAVSKFHPQEAIMEAYNVGQRDFGESRVQELEMKVKVLPDDIRWHFIGHLQTNKVKQLIPHAYLIHSVDSVKLLECINKEARRQNLIVNILIQIHVALEETKFGFTKEECLEIFSKNVAEQFANVRICGIMGMATNTEDESEIRKEFKQLKSVFDTLKATAMADNPYFKEISMGMSDDYRIAVEEGSTIVRVGSSIFGTRQY